MRTMIFVDGFNLYHSICDISKNYGNQKNYLKWLDLLSLGRSLLTSHDTLDGGYYFSAYATWIGQNSQDRHRAYINALKMSGINVILGNFKQKPRTCRKCGEEWINHEEKESDVNIALYILQMAHEDKYDRAIIFTADTDLVPAIKMVRNNFPNKEVKVAIPKRRVRNAKSLQQAANGIIRLNDSHFERNLFPERLIDSTGKYVLRPTAYDPPKGTI